MYIKMRRISRVGLLLLCTGCGHVSPNPAPPYFTQIYYKNASGEDLLNPLTAGHINKDGIRVSDLVSKNGTMIETAATVNMTDSCGSYVCLSSKTGYYYVQFRPNSDYKGSLIHFGSSITDTLVYETKPVYSGLGVTRVLHNGKELWSATPTSTTILKMTIVK